MLDEAFNLETMSPWITDTATLIRPYVEADPTKFFSASNFETSLTSSISGTFGLTSFIENRYAAIASQLAGSSQSDNGGAGNCGNGNGMPGGGGPGGKPGGHPKCPDGICDAAEQANPNLVLKIVSSLWWRATLWESWPRLLRTTQTLRAGVLKSASLMT